MTCALIGGEALAVHGIARATDPRAGAVRIRRRTEQTDIIVGRPWVHRVLDRTIRVRVRGEELPVVDRTDLVLLKLFAGGPQDLLDVRLLLEAGGNELRDQVERRLSGVPPEIRRTWRHLRSAPP